MKYFRLPDLGEGLTEAEICEWFVQAGDAVAADQLLVSVETAKAIVEIPSPQAGTISALFGQPGDMLHVGEPLVEFAGEASDAGTVVGELSGEHAEEESGQIMEDFIIGSPRARAEQPAVTRAYPDALRGVLRRMARNMAEAHAQVVPVTLFDDADVHEWPDGEDTTVRMAQAMASACIEAPALNAWFDGQTETRQLHTHVDLGIAVNTPDGLFVPVLRDIARRSAQDLREGIDRLRADVQARAIPPAEMTGATITLTNFGALGGRYGTPIVIPPMVAIVGAGMVREDPVVRDRQLCIRRQLPLSLTFDHRVVTGAEAARFLGALVTSLASPGVTGVG